MSLLVVINSTDNVHNRLLSVHNCQKSRCRNSEIKVYNTVLLRTAEILVILFTILLNVLLVTAVSTPRCRFATPFFKLIRILSLMLLLHSIASMTLKTMPSLLEVTFPYQNEVSLWIDLFSRYFTILLILILAFNRFCVLIVGRLDELLFSGFRYVAFPCITFVLAAVMTAMVVELCEMERTYIVWLGFVDSVESPQLYVASGHCFLAFPVMSLLLNIVVVLWVRKKRFHSSKSTAVDKAERRMCIQVVLLALTQLVFIASFTVLSVVPVNRNDFYFIISLYNILSAIPELLIPAFVMSLITVTDDLKSVARGDLGIAPSSKHCSGRSCKELLQNAHVSPTSSLTLRIAEVVMFGTALVINLLLITAIICARKRCDSTFFKLLFLLSALFLWHCLFVLALKLLPIFLLYSFTYQNEASLYIDIFVKYYSIFLILVISFDRFCVFMAKRLEDIISSSCGFWVLPTLCFFIAAAATVAAVKVDEVKRIYVSGLGYVDYSTSTFMMTVTNYCSIVVSFSSIALHVAVYLWMRKSRSTLIQFGQHAIGRAERLISIQIIVIASLELVCSRTSWYYIALWLKPYLFQIFLLIFFILPLINMDKNQLYFVISLYNILCSIPELLIPAFVLFTSRDLLQSLGQIIGQDNSVRSTKTTSLKGRIT
ncbi:hypothetical protein Y032_0023g761 [Ancylostoma ceylanicum]|nr:hypothetical protein Y032_0023g761 [Ancylostoma ceylanicum]